ncbi:MAG: hypothetical protein Fur0022_02270 [Anaerolineales bacterium]
MNAYESRRARWLKLSEYLPPELKGRIALRNIRATAFLSPQAQQTLAKAVDAGLRQAGVLRILQNNPDATLDEVIRLLQSKRKAPKNGQPFPQDMDSEAASHELANLIQVCFPGWNRIAADSLAVDPLTAELRALIHAWRVCRDSERAQSETFTVLLCGFIIQAADHLNHILASQPNLHSSLQASQVVWPFTPSVQEHGTQP